MGITRFLTRFTVCVLPLACTAPADDTARAYFNADSTTATYPTLLNAPDLARANLAPAATFDENTLAARLSALRARAAALNGPVLTNAERARLRRGVRR